MSGLLRGEVTAVSYRPNPEVELETAQGILTALVGMEQSCPWWIGDLLNWAEAKWGEEASQLWVGLTRVEWDTCRRYKQVAGCYPPEERVAGASFSHHRELMQLPAPEREQWLARVVEEGLSVMEVRRLRWAQLPEGGEKPPYPPDLLATIQQLGRDLRVAWDEGRAPLSYQVPRPDGTVLEVTIKVRRPPSPAA